MIRIPCHFAELAQKERKEKKRQKEDISGK
jgi:hypothetical protein